MSDTAEIERLRDDLKRNEALRLRDIAEIEELRAYLKRSDEVIEQCAMVAEAYPGKIGGKFGRAIADSIRKLKETDPIP